MHWNVFVGRNGSHRLYLPRFFGETCSLGVNSGNNGLLLLTVTGMVAGSLKG